MEGRARAAESEAKNRAWLAWTTAALTRTKTMPSLAHMLGGDSQAKAGQTGEQRRSLMKAFILKAGGSIAKRGDG